MILATFPLKYGYHESITLSLYIHTFLIYIHVNGNKKINNYVFGDQVKDNAMWPHDT